MLKFIRETLRHGLRQFTENPQLWLTVLVAIAIFVSYIYLANRFITIAQDAQERLVNVRVGALQDAFVPFAGTMLEEPDALRERMQSIVKSNSTITDFYILERVDEEWVITLSIEEGEEGEIVREAGILPSLAVADSSNSFTQEEVEGDERFFTTARAIPRGEPDLPQTIALTRQTLSEADQQVAESIQQGIVILILVLLFLMLLFLRHSRIIDYTVLYRKLKDVDQLKDDFISMASHELRTPLTAIRGYAELLRKKNEIQSEEGKQFLERIEFSAEELDQLVADMLDVSRIEQGRMALEFEAVNPKESIMGVVDTFRFKAEDKGLSMRAECADGLSVTADKARLKQVLVNLVGNAIKYTKEGEITITLEEGEGGYAQIRVSDTGIGIEASEQERLFEKFYRAKGEDTRRQIGTGLGLWITKQLVEEMNGKISIESIKGVGSHFVVALPLVVGE